MSYYFVDFEKGCEHFMNQFKIKSKYGYIFKARKKLNLLNIGTLEERKDLLSKMIF